MKRRNVRPWGRAERLVVLTACVGLAACQHGMMGTYEQIRPYMAQNRYQEASRLLTETKDEVYSKRDRVMFWLDRGTLLHYAGELEASTRDFVAAEKAIDVLFTRSISRGVASMLTNPGVTEYQGEDHEKVLLYLYTALNHAMMGEVEEAAVEARRAQERLHALEVYYRQEGGLGTLYTRDAFLYWLAGILLEDEGSFNDALVALRRAYETYEGDYARLFGVGPPAFLAEDIVRVALEAGIDDVAEIYRARGGTGESLEALRTGGEVVVVVGVGESPLKRDTFIDAETSSGYLLRVAIPALEVIPSLTAQVRVEAAGVDVAAALVEPVETIAMANYAHRLPKITAMATARAVSKFVAVQGLQAAGEALSKDQGGVLGDLIGGVANVVGYLTEEADKRSWRTLPARFYVARLVLPEGTHRVEVSFQDPTAREVDRIVLDGVSVHAGRRTFRSVRSLE